MDDANAYDHLAKAEREIGMLRGKNAQLEGIVTRQTKALIEGAAERDRSSLEITRLREALERIAINAEIDTADPHAWLSWCAEKARAALEGEQGANQTCATEGPAQETAPKVVSGESDDEGESK